MSLFWLQWGLKATTYCDFGDELEKLMLHYFKKMAWTIFIYFHAIMSLENGGFNYCRWRAFKWDTTCPNQLTRTTNPYWWSTVYFAINALSYCRILWRLSMHCQSLTSHPTSIYLRTLRGLARGTSVVRLSPSWGCWWEPMLRLASLTRNSGKTNSAPCWTYGSVWIR